MAKQQSKVPEHLRDVMQHGGFTHQEMEDIRVKQITKSVKMVPANAAKNIPDQWFRKDFEGYKIAEHEVGNYHVAMEARLFDHNTGEKKSRARVQIFDPETFEWMTKNNGFYGSTTFVLHNPTLKGQAKNTIVPPVDDNAPDDNNDDEPNELNNPVEVTPEMIDALSSIDDARVLYKSTVGKGATKTWDLDTIKLKLSEFIGAL